MPASRIYYRSRSRVEDDRAVIGDDRRKFFIAFRKRRHERLCVGRVLRQLKGLLDALFSMGPDVRSRATAKRRPASLLRPSTMAPGRGNEFKSPRSGQSNQALKHKAEIFQALFRHSRWGEWNGATRRVMTLAERGRKERKQPASGARQEWAVRHGRCNSVP
jgi:hypothetical protein